ncbi:MAG: flagellar hook-associated protein FlgK [Deltaproteobacteria bacterium]|nr:flagellar hook-associated protein FlgK [Deltaproteobacteria bacterium]
MSLLDVLRTSRDALAAQQHGISVTSANVSNVNTPGYARRSALLETQAVGGRSFGTVRVVGIAQARDAFVESRWLGITGQSAAAAHRDRDLASLEGIFSESLGNGIGSSLGALLGSFQALATHPADATVRATVLERATQFANGVSSAATRIEALRTDQLATARIAVEEVNQKAARVAALSERIHVAEGLGQDAADLKDQRTQVLLGLAELVDIRTFHDAQGRLVVQGAGTTLVEGGSARALSLDVGTDGSMRFLIERSSGPPSDITALLSGGKLAGIRDARDGDEAATLARLDALARDFATAVNTAHAAGYGLDSVSGRALFTFTGSPAGAAATLRVDPAMVGAPDRIGAAGTIAGLPGDATAAAALAALADAKILSGGTRTAVEGYSDLVGDIGLRKESAALEAQTRDGMRAQVQELRETQSGVSLDEEMVALTGFQRAYEAASRVLTTVDQLLGDLIASVGR